MIHTVEHYTLNNGLRNLDFVINLVKLVELTLAVVTVKQWTFTVLLKTLWRYVQSRVVSYVDV